MNGIRFDPGTDSVKGIAQAIRDIGAYGVGHKLSMKIAQQFGRHSIDIIIYEPSKLTEIEGIGKGKAEQLKASVKEYFGPEIKNAEMDANERWMREAAFFGDLGIHGWTLRVIREMYGEHAMSVVKSNPYQLTAIDGIGFRRADEIAQKLGYTKDDPRRIREGLKYVLEEMTNKGHCCMPAVELVRESTKSTRLDVYHDVIEPILQEMIKDGSLIEDMDVVYHPKYWQAEEYVATKLTDMVCEVADSRVPFVIQDVMDGSKVQYNDDQQRAIRMALTNNVSIITGGPGTGKTTVLRGIIEALKIMKKSYSMCAPTGCAQKRMSMSTGSEAKTLHRLLEYSNGDFKRNQENPLDCDVVIVDEMSMVDIALMQSLLSAMTLRQRIIMIGDNDQLPSVGPGRVLGDMIDSGVIPTVKLTQIYRQAENSNIVLNANRIINGILPEVKNEEFKDFFFVNAISGGEAQKTVVEFVSERLPKAYPGQEIQVICPSRKKGDTCSNVLNKLLQKAINPYGREIRYAGSRFRLDDRVMQTKNNYTKWVFNGEVGKITAVASDQISVHYGDSELSTKYEDEEILELQLAYATTIHKSQGSEYDIVVIPIMGSDDFMLQRNLLYTAVTRAKNICIIVGSWNAVKKALERWKQVHRHTRLAVRLKVNLQHLRGDIHNNFSHIL